MNPNMPDYITHDLYTHNVGYAMDKKIRNNKPTSPSGIVQAFSSFGNQDWENVQIINVTPLSFDDYTRKFMLERRFGYQPITQIPDDAKRTNIQMKISELPPPQGRGLPN